MATIAFIGLGNMGGGMAASLLRAGHVVRAYDVWLDALEQAEAAGAVRAQSVGQALDGADAMVTMLPADRHVEQVLDQALKAAAPGTLFIDSSTVGVMTSKSMIARAAAAGFDMVDAPVSGGIASAAAGTLTFMVGGTDAAFARAQPILAAMGRTIIRAGDPGHGQAAKLCNSAMIGANMVAACEGFALARKLGLNAQTFYDIVSQSSGQSWAVTSYCPVPGVGPDSPADHGYHGGFSADQVVKDLGLAVRAGMEAGAPTPMTSAATALYQLLVAAGHGDRDFSMMIEMLEGDLPG